MSCDQGWSRAATLRRHHVLLCCSSTVKSCTQSRTNYNSEINSHQDPIDALQILRKVCILDAQEVLVLELERKYSTIYDPPTNEHHQYGC